MLRVCKKCGVEKDIEGFTKAKKNKYGCTHVCKNCSAKYQKLRSQRADIIKPPNGMKRTCRKCGVEKDVGEFRELFGCKYGYGYTCKKCFVECTKIRCKKYRDSPRGKEIQNKYRNNPQRKISSKKYDMSSHGKKARKEYRNSPRGKMIVERSLCKNVKALSAAYVAVLLKPLKAKDIPPALLCLKREQIKIKRLIKEKAL